MIDKYFKPDKVHHAVRCPGASLAKFWFAALGVHRRQHILSIICTIMITYNF